jgi:hypothetical protein
MNNTNSIQPIYECICSTDLVYTILSILGFIVPLLVSEILPLSNCEANGIIDGIIKLSKQRRQIAPRRPG